MLLDFLFGLGFVLMMIILLAVVMSLCPKWGFALANKEVKKEMQDYPKPPKSKKILCVFVIVVLVAAFIAMMIYACADGIQNGFSFWRMWLRFMIIFYVEKAFDLFVLDYLWVKKSRWFQRKFSKLNNCEALNNFKVFRKEQIVRLVSHPFVCALLAGLVILLNFVLCTECK